MQIRATIQTIEVEDGQVPTEAVMASPVVSVGSLNISQTPTTTHKVEAYVSDLWKSMSHDTQMLQKVW